MNNNDFKFINLNSKDADVYEKNNDKSKLTFFLKNPIVLNDEYDVKVSNFSLKKTINDEIIEYENELASVFNNSNDRDILPRPYNTNVEIVSVVNVVLYEFVGSAFVATAARATVSCVATQPDTTTGQIQVDSITTPGTGFVLNNFLYIDKDDLTNTFNTYTNRYAEIKITGLVDDDVVLTLSNYATRTILPATGNPINERTYDNMVLYKSDGAGWYIDSEVRANVEVAYPYAGATFANINILSITDGGDSISLNQILYIDKALIIAAEPTMTYTVRFAEYQATELVNGLGAVVLSANVEILADPREITFVNDVISDVPLLKLESGSYIESGALVEVSLLANPTNDNRGQANILTIINPGRAYLPFETYYIDKDAVTQNNNTFSPSARYASYIINTTTNNSNLEVVFATNYGFTYTPRRDYYYDVPGKNTRIYINIYNNQTYGNMARIRYTEGTRSGFAVNDEITIPSSDIVDTATGLPGWNKAASSGNLKLKVLALTSVSFPHFGYEISLENLIYNNFNYHNSNNNFKPVLMRVDAINKNIQGDNIVLRLAKQIISTIVIGVTRLVDAPDNLNIGLLLKRKNILLK